MGERLIVVVENCTGDTAVRVNQMLAALISDSPLTPAPSYEAVPQPIVKTDVPDPIQVPAVTLEPVKEEPAPDLRKAEPIVSQTDFFEEPIPEEDALNTPVQSGAKTLRGALEQNDVKAIVQCLFDSKNLPENTRHTVNKICRQFLQRDLDKREPAITAVQDIKAFVTAYLPFLKTPLRQILSQTGYESIEDFFQYSEEWLVQEAYRSLLEAIRNEL